MFGQWSCRASALETVLPLRIRAAADNEIYRLMTRDRLGRDYLIRDIVFWTGLGFACLSIALPIFRHFIYLLPFMVLLALLGDRKIRFGDEAKPFIAFVLAGLALYPIATGEGLKDLYFTFTGVSIALLADIPRLSLWRLFLTLFACMVVLFFVFGDFRVGLRFDFSKSYSSFEGSFSFMFGLIAPLALMQRRFRLFVLCVVMTIVSLKRIAVVAIICAVFFVMLGEKRARRVLNPLVMISINLLVLLVVFMYAYGSFDAAILKVTGQSANQFGMGRQSLLTLPATEVFSHPERFVFFGQGPGSSYILANQGIGLYGTTQRLHSDLVKIFYEYGLIFYCLMIGLMYSAKNFATRIGFLFMNVIFLTDNTLIYAFVIFMFVCCMRQMEDAAPGEKAGVPNKDRRVAYAGRTL